MLCKNVLNLKAIIIFFTVIIYLSLAFIKQTEITSKSDDLKLVLEKTFNQSDRTYDSILAETPRRFAIISSNLFSESDYMFNLPFVALAWRRLGIEPIVLLVKSNITKPNELTNKTIEYLNKFRVKTVYVQSPDNYDVTVGMLSRLFAGLLPRSMVKDQDFVLTTDSDLIPIDKNYYSIDNSNHIRAWNAFCCEPFTFENKEYNMYPLSHIGMRKYQWSEMMMVNSSVNTLDGHFILAKIGELIHNKELIKANDDLVKGNDAWYLDQTAVNVNLQRYVEKTKHHLEKIHLVKSTRLDRSMSKRKWLKKIAMHFDTLTDCHSFQSDVFRAWPYLQPLFEKMFNHKFKVIFDRYYAEYTSLGYFKMKNQYSK